MKRLIRGTGISLASLPLQLLWVLMLGMLWWLMTQGDASAWVIGLPTVLLAVMSITQAQRHVLSRFSVSGLMKFIVLFLGESVRGGVDVARRVLGPTLRIRPGFVNYRTRLTDPHARVLLISCISLLPGTLAAHMKRDQIEIHLLDLDTDPVPGLHQLEQSIAGMLAITLENTHE